MNTFRTQIRILTFLIIALSTFLTSHVSGQSPTPDALFLRAQSLAAEQKFEEARAVCLEILQINPDYHDAAILKAKTFAWQNNYSQAETLLEELLLKVPNNRDAMAALANVLVWSGKYAEALPHLDKLLIDRPTDTGLLFSKALALNGTGEAEAAGVLLNQILTLDPTHASSQSLLLELEARRLRNFITMGYKGDYFDATTPWHIMFFEAGRRTRHLGTVISRINIAHRRGETGVQAEIDAYPVLRQGTYMYLNAGFSPHTLLFPQFRAGAELFQRISNAWELSAGGRLLAFENNNLWIATGSLSHYLGQYLFTFRPYFTFSDAGFSSQSYFFTARRYFSSPVHHLSLTIGTGFAADEDALLGGEIYNIESNQILLQYQQKISDRMLFRIGTGFQNYPEGIWGNKYSFEAGVTYLF